MTLNLPVTNWSLLLAMAISSGGDPTTPTDNNGNTWSPQQNPSPDDFTLNHNAVYVWYSKRVTSGSTTINFPGLAVGDSVMVYEIAGYADLDVLSYFSTDPPNLDETFINTIAYNDIIVAMFIGHFGDDASLLEPGTESTLIEKWTASTDDGTFPLLTEYLIASDPNNYESTCIDSATLPASASLSVAFRPIESFSPPQPSPAAIIPGFAIMAQYNATGDGNLTSNILFTPSSDTVTIGEPVAILWNSTNVPFVSFEGDNEPFNIETGNVLSTGSGIFFIPGGLFFTSTITCVGLNSSEDAISTQNITIQVTGPPLTIPITISSVSESTFAFLTRTNGAWHASVMATLDYGDGTVITNPTPDSAFYYNHTYAAPGIYNLTVVPAPGASAIDTFDVFNSPAVTAIDVSGLGSVWDLDIAETAITTIDLSKMPNLTFILCFSSSITALDFSHNPLLTNVVAADCVDLADVNLLGALSLTSVGFSQCNLDVTQVNRILADLVANNAQNGGLNLNSGGNAAPTGQGLTDRDTLVSRGWSVSTN